MTLLASYSESNNDDTGRLGVSGDFQKGGESFDSGAGGILNTIKFELQKVSSPTGNIYVRVYAHMGTYGTNGTPTGSALAVSDAVDVAAISTSRGLVSFSFSGANKITLTANTKYFAVCEYTSGGGTNYVNLWADVSSSTAGGNLWTDPGGADSGVDIGFYVYVDDAVSSAVKTAQGLAKASVKTVNGLAIASVKTMNGLA